MLLPRILRLVDDFKMYCKSRGWRTSQDEDCIEADNEYHNFVWTRTVKPVAFKKMAEKQKFAIRRGTAYRIVDVDYTAWLFSETLSEEFQQISWGNPELFKKTAIYDLSWIKSEEPTCMKLNLTESQVFREFESYLNKTRRIQVRPLKTLVSQPA